MNFTLTSHLRRFLIILTVWVLMVIVVYLADWYFWSVLQRKAESLVKAKSAALALELKRTALLGERLLLREHRQDIERIEDIFVDPANPLGFIETVEKISKDYGVVLKLQSPGKKETAITIRFSAEGPIGRVLDFVRKVERLPEQVILDEFSLEILTGVVPSSSQIGASKSKTEASTMGRVSGLMEILAR